MPQGGRGQPCRRRERRWPIAVAPGRYRVRRRLRLQVGAVGIARPGALAAKAATNAGGAADWGAWEVASRADERQGGCRYDEYVGHETQVGCSGGFSNPIQRFTGARSARDPFGYASFRPEHSLRREQQTRQSTATRAKAQAFRLVGRVGWINRRRRGTALGSACLWSVHRPTGIRASLPYTRSTSSGYGCRRHARFPWRQHADRDSRTTPSAITAHPLKLRVSIRKAERLIPRYECKSERARLNRAALMEA